MPSCRRLREALGKPMSRTMHEGECEDALPIGQWMGDEMRVQFA
jgi:hypothetical protein